MERRQIWNLIELMLIFMSSFCYAQEEKSYDVTNDKAENMLGQMETQFDFTDVQVIMREHYLNGTFSVFEDLNNDEHEMEVKMYTSPNGDGIYQLLTMGVPKGPVCEGFHKFFVKFVQPSLVEGENTNFPYIDPQDGLCPIPKGDYWAKEIIIDTAEWPTNFPRGTLKVVITFFKNDLSIGGLTAFFLIEDRDD